MPRVIWDTIMQNAQGGYAPLRSARALQRARARLPDLKARQARQEQRDIAGVELPARPDAHLCKISQEPMSDPVVAADGHTYERSLIEKWLRTNNTSPMTREPLSDHDLHPNLNLKSLIGEWEEQVCAI